MLLKIASVQYHTLCRFLRAHHALVLAASIIAACLLSICAVYFNEKVLNYIHHHCPDNPFWVHDMHKWTNHKAPRSQGSQEYYFGQIFSVIGTTNRFFVEYGFNEPNYVAGGSGANSWSLYDQGWRGLLLDAGHHNSEINLQTEFLSSHNIAEIFRKYNVPKEPDLLSSDMDSHDLWVLKAIMQAGYRPRVVTTEYNSNYPIHSSLTLVDPALIDAPKAGVEKFTFMGCAWGASAGAFKHLLGDEYGYKLVGRVGHLDLIWVRGDLLWPCFPNVPEYEWFFRDAAIGALHHSKVTSRSVVDEIVDYQTYLETNDVSISREAALTALRQFNLTCFSDVKL